MNAVAEAVARTENKLHIVTDSQYVKDTIETIWGDPKPYWGKHGDLWNFVTERRDRIAEVTWIKSHMTRHQAREKGFPENHWELNDRADRLATKGANEHISTNTREKEERYKLARKYRDAS